MNGVSSCPIGGHTENYSGEHKTRTAAKTRGGKTNLHANFSDSKSRTRRRDHHRSVSSNYFDVSRKTVCYISTSYHVKSFL